MITTYAIWESTNNRYSIHLYQDTTITPYSYTYEEYEYGKPQSVSNLGACTLVQALLKIEQLVSYYPVKLYQKESI